MWGSGQGRPRAPDPVRRIRGPARGCRPGEPGGAGEVLLEDGQEKSEKLGLGDSMRSLYSSAARVKLQQPDSCYAKFSEYNIFDIWLDD